MPYIDKDRRERLWVAGGEIPANAGELNFQITDIIVDYAMSKEKLSYQVINDIMGALEGAKQEFYRRVAVPYEKKKIKENGDVYPEQLL